MIKSICLLLVLCLTVSFKCLAQNADFRFLGEPEKEYIYLVSKNEKSLKEPIVLYFFKEKKFIDIHRVTSRKSNPEFSDFDFRTLDLFTENNQSVFITDTDVYWIIDFKVKVKKSLFLNDVQFVQKVALLENDKAIIVGYDTSLVNHVWTVDKKGKMKRFDSIPQRGEVLRWIKHKNELYLVCKRGLLQLKGNEFIEILPELSSFGELYAAKKNDDYFDFLVYQESEKRKQDVVVAVDLHAKAILESKKTKATIFHDFIGRDSKSRIWFKEETAMYYELNGKTFVFDTMFEQVDYNLLQCRITEFGVLFLHKNQFLFIE